MMIRQQQFKVIFALKTHFNARDTILHWVNNFRTIGSIYAIYEQNENMMVVISNETYFHLNGDITQTKMSILSC